MSLIPDSSGGPVFIQIEEPAEQEQQDPGLAIGIELIKNSIRVAISVGGNVEALQGYEGDGCTPALISQGGSDLAVGIDAIKASHGDSARSLALAIGLQSILADIRREVTAKAQRLVTGAVAVVPPGLDRGTLAMIMGAVEGAEMALLGIIETPVALAYADGLDRRADGTYRFKAGNEIYAVSVENGVIRLETDDAATVLLELRAPIEHAVLGAALLAEVRNAEQT